MTAPDSTPAPDEAGPSLIRSAVWVAIGALIAAAIVCVVWVLVGPQNDIIGRAFLTILLLAGFAGAALFDAHVAPQRPSWYVLASMIGWVFILLAGAFKIWMPEADSFQWWDSGFSRFIAFLGIILVVRLALLHVRLYLRSHARYVTTFTRIIAVVTVVLVGVLAVMLLIPLTFPHEFAYPELYWRFVVAVTILAAVGTALIPLINALNAPRRPARVAAPAPYAAQLQQWPTYVDGVTPLPVLPDGSPDWNAYYTGYPSGVSQAIAPVAMMPVPPPLQEWPAPTAPEPAPAAPAPTPAPAPAPAPAPTPAAPEVLPPGPRRQGSTPPTPYEGYPPPPPLPPRPQP